MQRVVVFCAVELATIPVTGTVLKGSIHGCKCIRLSKRIYRAGETHEAKAHRTDLVS